MKKIKQVKAEEEKTSVCQTQETFKNSYNDDFIKAIEYYLSIDTFSIPKDIRDVELQEQLIDEYINKKSINPRYSDYRRYCDYIKFVYDYSFYMDITDSNRLIHIYNNIDTFVHNKNIKRKKIINNLLNGK